MGQNNITGDAVWSLLDDLSCMQDMVLRYTNVLKSKDIEFNVKAIVEQGVCVYITADYINLFIVIVLDRTGQMTFKVRMCDKGIEFKTEVRGTYVPDNEILTDVDAALNKSLRILTDNLYIVRD